METVLILPDYFAISMLYFVISMDFDAVLPAFDRASITANAPSSFITVA
jgi:hypothetical protein